MEHAGDILILDNNTKTENYLPRLGDETKDYTMKTRRRNDDAMQVNFNIPVYNSSTLPNQISNNTDNVLTRFHNYANESVHANTGVEKQVIAPLTIPKDHDDITFVAKVHLNSEGKSGKERENKTKDYNQLFGKIRNDIIKDYNEMFDLNSTNLPDPETST